MEGWGPDRHNGRGPAWPAPQRSVVLVSSVLQDHPAFQGPGNGSFLPTRKCQPATQFIDNFKTSPLDTLLAVLSERHYWDDARRMAQLNASVSIRRAVVSDRMPARDERRESHLLASELEACVEGLC